MNDVDIQLIAALQANGRATLTDLASLVNLSVPAVRSRVKRLEASGIITGYAANLDPAKAGYGVTAFVHVSVVNNGSEDSIVEAILQMADILELHRVTGDTTFLVKVRQRDTTSLGQTLKAIQRIPDVATTSTSVVVQTDREAAWSYPRPMTAA